MDQLVPTSRTHSVGSDRTHSPRMVGLFRCSEAMSPRMLFVLVVGRTLHIRPVHPPPTRRLARANQPPHLPVVALAKPLIDSSERVPTGLTVHDLALPVPSERRGDWGADLDGISPHHLSSEQTPPPHDTLGGESPPRRRSHVTTQLQGIVRQHLVGGVRDLVGEGREEVARGLPEHSDMRRNREHLGNCNRRRFLSIEREGEEGRQALSCGKGHSLDHHHTPWLASATEQSHQGERVPHQTQPQCRLREGVPVKRFPAGIWRQRDQSRCSQDGLKAAVSFAKRERIDSELGVGRDNNHSRGHHQTRHTPPLLWKLRRDTSALCDLGLWITHEDESHVHSGLHRCSEQTGPRSWHVCHHFCCVHLWQRSSFCSPNWQGFARYFNALPFGLGLKGERQDDQTAATVLACPV
mmetsp:Transcript_36355/g.84361  ORF Transcript_36355/g.84361 Transcript_36355/m.84361 type:complete len:410 (+) Transcript_36355:585-1814(+)